MAGQSSRTPDRPSPDITVFRFVDIVRALSLVLKKQGSS